jgi:hypothetical protein
MISDFVCGTGQPDLSHMDEITLNRILGKLVLTIGTRQFTLSPEQESKFWEQIQELVWKDGGPTLYKNL